MTKPPKIPESVLVVIYTRHLDVLLIERADAPGFWQSVTGSKDFVGESLRQTVEREVAEETGIVVGRPPLAASALTDWQVSLDYEIYPQWRHRYAPEISRNTEHWFGLEVPAGTAVTLAPREHTDFAWLPWREAAAKCFSASNRTAILQLPQRVGNAGDV
ncbi:MAG: dihydroneopterin triphosphate diphosphatase [Janthinobacterium lividum]